MLAPGPDRTQALPCLLEFWEEKQVDMPGEQCGAVPKGTGSGPSQAAFLTQLLLTD